MLFFYVHVTREKLPKQRFIQKICSFNVDEIDTCVHSYCAALTLSPPSVQVGLDMQRSQQGSRVQSYYWTNQFSFISSVEYFS